MIPRYIQLAFKRTPPCLAIGLRSDAYQLLHWTKRASCCDSRESELGGEVIDRYWHIAGMPASKYGLDDVKALSFRCNQSRWSETRHVLVLFRCWPSLPSGLVSLGARYVRRAGFLGFSGDGLSPLMLTVLRNPAVVISPAKAMVNT